MDGCITGITSGKALVVEKYLKRVVAGLCLIMIGAGCVSSDGTESNADGSPDSTGIDAASSDEPNPGFDGPVNVIVANTSGTLTTVDPQRVMTALLGDGPNSFLGGPDRPVTVVYSPVNGGSNNDAEGGSTEGQWLTTNAAALGLYVSYFEFPVAGPWRVAIEADGEELGAALIDVVEESPVPKIGDAAPRTESPTAANMDEASKISTDPEPDLSLYRLSVAEAVENGRPTVVVFATPAFCQTALCGPTLEAVKSATNNRDGIDVVHVEPFDLDLAPEGTLQPIPAMADWGLITEPWVFVIDAQGMVAASFEGIVVQTELAASLDAL